jgi:hypothetical protein
MSSKRRPLSFALAVVAASLMVGSSPTHAVAPAAVVTASDADSDDTTTTLVASEPPVGNQPGVKSPTVLPVPDDVESAWSTGAWWLAGFGGLQLVGLFFVTRRARARLSTDDARS